MESRSRYCTEQKGDRVVVALLQLAGGRPSSRFIATAVDRYQLRLVLYDVAQEVIVQWL